MRGFKIILAIIGTLIAFSAADARESFHFEKSKLHLSWNIDKVKIYEHEPAVLTLYLWTPGIDVRGVAETKAPSLKNGKFSYVSHADYNRNMQVVEDEDGIWYVYPVDRYVVAFDRKGKYELKDGRYRVDMAIPQIYDDPFWGRMQTMGIESIEVPVDELDINVQSLPDASNGMQFSGAVGQFDVNVVVPPGDIYLNEEAIAIITVRGPGWINNQTLPQYHEAFKQGTKLKSFSEERRQYMDGDEMISEVQLECTFIPTSKDDAIIGPVKIEYFNPKTRQYVTATSADVKVNVKSIAGKSPVHDI